MSEVLIVDDNSEFGLLIQQVVSKEIPAYIEGDRVFRTNGIELRKGGKIISEIVVTLGRNDPCWCGSGKKFKKCHGVTL